MIDVHVIPCRGFDVSTIVRQLHHPKITVQVADWVEGNILEARWRAFQLGTHPYVSWVDGDDEVVSVEWVDRALEILEAHPDVAAVYPRWYTTENGQQKMAPYHPWSPELHRAFSTQPLAHHLTIMRRHNVMQLLDEAKAAVGKMVKLTEAYLTFGQMRYGRLVALEDVAYNWRLRPGTGRSSIEPSETTEWFRRFTN